MKIVLELSREEAHNLNALVVAGHKAESWIDPDQDEINALAEWNRAYQEGMRQGDSNGTPQED